MSQAFKNKLNIVASHTCTYKTIMSKMKFIPILFQTLMVQATLEDCKTMTRRLKGLEFINESESEWEYQGFDKIDLPGYEGFGHIMHNKTHGSTNSVKCPYGQPGDVLWVRESFNYFGSLDPGYLSYKATYPKDLPTDVENVPEITKVKFKPSIHMPKTACRIFLEITDIRVERLQDISEADAKAEGVESLGLYPGYNVSSKGKFEGLWYLINGAESYNANPWVWVISFKKIERPVNFI